MVKDAEWRKRKYEAGVNPEVIGARFGQVKEGMVRQESTYFPQIALVEGEVKRLVEAAGVPTFEVAQYVNVGRVCYSIAKRFSQATRDQEAQRVVNHWASRGLDGPLLAQACRAGGCEVEAPAAVCYNPCVHGSDKHDMTVLDTEAKLLAAEVLRGPIFACYTNGIATAGTYYHSMEGQTQNPAEGNVSSICPTRGRIRNLIAQCSVGPAAGESMTLTLRINGGDSLLTVTFNPGENLKEDLVNVAGVARGHLLDWKIVKVGNTSVGKVSWGVEFRPITP